MKFVIDENGIHYYDLPVSDSATAPASGDNDQGSVIPDAVAVAKVKQVAQEISDALGGYVSAEYAEASIWAVVGCECRAQGAPTLCGGCE